MNGTIYYISTPRRAYYNSLYVSTCYVWQRCQVEISRSFAPFHSPLVRWPSFSCPVSTEYYLSTHRTNSSTFDLRCGLGLFSPFYCYSISQNDSFFVFETFLTVRFAFPRRVIFPIFTAMFVFSMFRILARCRLCCVYNDRLGRYLDTS